MLTKRATHAAEIRHKAVSYILEVCRHKDFEQVFVTEICQHIGISKVTFFKYFDRKEDLLMLVYSVLNVRLCISLAQQQLSGRAAMEVVINSFGKLLTDTPSLAWELVTVLLRSKPPVLPVRLTEADRALFFPEVDFSRVEVVSFHDLIEGLMLDGILKKEITKMTDASELADMFLTNLFGAVVAAHISNRGPAGLVYNNIVRNWLRCLQ